MAHIPLILVVDDEDDVRDLVCMNLRRSGFETVEARDGMAALQSIRLRRPDAVILDVMMPGHDGLWVCEQMRNDDALKIIPVIMLTAKGQPDDRIAGLEKGADDYVAKPFSPKELVLRVHAVLRRFPTQEKHELREGPFHFDHGAVELSIDGKLFDLTLIEFKLLHFLAMNRGKSVERDTILNEVWGYRDGMLTRTLDTHMRRLRAKLGEHSDWIHTSRGHGYLFENPLADSHAGAEG